MIDTHRTPKRPRNTAHAYEDIVAAYQVAAQRGNWARAERSACTIEKSGISKLTSWQLGHSMANSYITRRNPTGA